MERTRTQLAGLLTVRRTSSASLLPPTSRPGLVLAAADCATLRLGDWLIADSSRYLRCARRQPIRRQKLSWLSARTDLSLAARCSGSIEGFSSYNQSFLLSSRLSSRLFSCSAYFLLQFHVWRSVNVRDNTRME